MKQTVVVDLDGTLFCTNTFKHYIVYVSKMALMKLDVFLVLKLFLFVFLRKCRLITSHEQLKKKILKNTIKYSDEVSMRKFVDKLMQFENKQVISMIERYRAKGYCTILSTAAPDCYAKIVAYNYAFEKCCSTNMNVNSEWRENVQEKKKENTLSCLSSINGVLSVMITDHYDDVPLLAMPKECNYVFSPTQKTKKKLEEMHIRYTIIG